MTRPKPRRQCAKCPWKKSTNPLDIPGDYSVELHRGLDVTIAEPGSFSPGPIRLMACHETTKGAELPCVGWLVQQLGPGNNIALRLRVALGRVDANVETVGEQHETFADTLPQSAPSC
jgi:hypothetical protein